MSETPKLTTEQIEALQRGFEQMRDAATRMATQIVLAYSHIAPIFEALAELLPEPIRCARCGGTSLFEEDVDGYAFLVCTDCNDEVGGL